MGVFCRNDCSVCGCVCGRGIYDYLRSVFGVYSVFQSTKGRSERGICCAATANACYWIACACFMVLCLRNEFYSRIRYCFSSDGLRYGSRVCLLWDYALGTAIPERVKGEYAQILTGASGIIV